MIGYLCFLLSLFCSWPIDRSHSRVQWLCKFLEIGHFRVPKTKAKRKSFLVKMSFVCMRIKNHFHINSFAVSLALKLRLEATRN